MPAICMIWRHASSNDLHSSSARVPCASLERMVFLPSAMFITIHDVPSRDERAQASSSARTCGFRIERRRSSRSVLATRIPGYPFAQVETVNKHGY